MIRIIFFAGENFIQYIEAKWFIRADDESEDERKEWDHEFPKSQYLKGWWVELGTEKFMDSIKQIDTALDSTLRGNVRGQRFYLITLPTKDGKDSHTLGYLRSNGIGCFICLQSSSRLFNIFISFLFKQDDLL